MSTLRLPRTLRLDPSDGFVFQRAAEPGEWAVTGSFLFARLPDSAFEGEAADPKWRAAFRSGFLGIGSFAWSTLVVVTEATDIDRERAVVTLAEQFVARLGAPSLEVAMPAAEEEIAFAAAICDHPPQTILALHRARENGELIERFRTLTPRGDRPAHAPRVFEIVESDEDELVEEVDLLSLRDRKT